MVCDSGKKWKSNKYWYLKISEVIVYSFNINKFSTQLFCIKVQPKR